nr:transaldolase [Actinomycetota bacterium]
MGRLNELFDGHGQSPWMDNLKRGWITSGELQRWVDRGVRGLTSNPTIFAKAIADSPDYDEQFSTLVNSGSSVDESYWGLVTTDIESALAILRPVYDASDGVDGYVSVEVSPDLALDSEGTYAAAQQLWDQIDEPNLYVKIPGTAPGVDAIRRSIAAGRNINVTLLFGLQRYDEVVEAYLAGLEELVAGGGDPSHVSSVASFFVSRVDTAVDRRLGEIGTPEALALKSKAALANARLAYQHFLRHFSGPRWEALAAAGARVQRPLWASTSTKDPSLPDTLYVDGLIGPDTVNTMPDATLTAVDDHGQLTRTVDADPAADEATVAALAALGIDLTALTVFSGALGVGLGFGLQ